MRIDTHQNHHHHGSRVENVRPLTGAQKSGVG